MSSADKKSFVSKHIDSLFSYFQGYSFSITRFVSEKFADFCFFIFQAKEKSKDLVKANLDLAENFIQNNNFYDAKIRYHVVLRLNPNNFVALIGLGFVYIKTNKPKKALQYFELALQHCTDEAKATEINSIIAELKQSA